MSLTALVVVLFGVALCGLVLFGAAWYVQRRPQEVDPSGATLELPGDRQLALPSAPYVSAMRKHVDSRRDELARLMRAGDLRRAWAQMEEPARRALLIAQREEVRLAVSAYVGGSLALLQDACPELSDESFERLATGDALLRTVQQLLDGKLPDTRGPAAAALADAVSAHLKVAGAGKAERAARGGFLHVFRRSCLVAFALALCEETGAKAKQRAAERQSFFMQLGKGAGVWLLGAVAMRFAPKIIEAGLEMLVA